ncbi:(S)-1-phenylethanol dehydrogenase [mine drainage metagenome]|uniref:(S)-1-phenylethanol dehydrogenase n=1 Tax=mine drainage metagenome TaxID=410659 RepID=A0A1J5SN95_9ZZZZ
MNTPSSSSGRLSGRTALVTGSTRGVGRLVAEAIAREGAARVLVHGRSEEACAETVRLVRAAGAEAIALTAELSDPAQVEALADRVLALGGVDILYNNAAVMHPWRESIDLHTQRDWEWSFQVNVFALVRLCARLIPSMRAKRWGRIVNVTSGIDKTPQLAGYGSSKWAVDKFTDDLAAELKGSGVIVSRLDPGWLRTDLGGQHAPNAPETVLPGALVPVLLPDDAAGGQFFRAQDYSKSGG